MAQDAAGAVSRGLAQISGRAAGVVGLVALAVTLLSLLSGPGVSSSPALIWLAAVLVWAAVLAVRAPVLRTVLQVLALLALASVPLTVPAMSAVPWVPVPVLAICASAAAALSLPIAGGVAVTALALAITLATTHASPEIFLTVIGEQAPWLSLPFIACIGVGLSVSRHYAGRLAAAADAAAQQTDEAAMLVRRANRAKEVRAAVDRRIHETVLNTLAAIANGGASAERLRRECRRDLEQMQLGFMPQTPSSLTEVVRSAMHVAGMMEAVLSVDILHDVELDRGPSGALRDAIVECLRNVERHARASSVHLVADADDIDVWVTVSDDGVGMAEDVQERFGVRNSIRAALAGMGGGATLTSVPGEGTTVRLVAPQRLRPPALPPPLQVPRSDRFIGRAGLLGPVVAAAVAMPAVTSGISLQPLLVSLMVAFTGTCLALAWPFAQGVLRLLARAVLLLGVLLLGCMSTAVTGCASAPAVACAIVAVIGSLFLALVDVGTSRIVRGLAVALPLASAILVLAALPAGCRGGALSILVLISVFVFGLLAIILTTLGTLAAQEGARRRAEQERRDADGEITEFLASRDAWAKVTGTTREVLAAIADGTVDPGDAFVRDRARIEEAQLRARLGQRDGSGLWHAVMLAAQEAAVVGRSIDLNVVGSGVEPRVAPAAIERLLRQLFTDAPSGSVIVRGMFIDGQEEVLVTAPADVIARAARGDVVVGVVVEAMPMAGDQIGQLMLRWQLPTSQEGSAASAAPGGGAAS